MNSPASKSILLGVCGGIAAYKAAELTRALIRRGFETRVVMTANATRFVTPLTFQALSGHPVGTDPWDEQAEGAMAHIEVARTADLFLIAPATAHTLARLAAGMADDLLTAAALATRAPVWVAPAMNPQMLAHPATQANLRTLESRGVRVLQSGEGEMACGDVGRGRLPEPDDLANAVAAHFARRKDLIGTRVLVTAGPTREHFDPVRYLSNPSTGRMGFALAAMAAERGATVCLIAGPSELPTPHGVERIDVVSADEMAQAALARYPDADLVIAAAAVSDYAPLERSEHKMKKGDDDLTLRLRRTPDILAEMGARRREGQVLVGFAAETDDAEVHAQEKLQRKKLDLIVLNRLNEPGAGFAGETNAATLFDRRGTRVDMPLTSKRAMSDLILDHARDFLPPKSE